KTPRTPLTPRHQGSQSYRYSDDTHTGHHHIESPFPRSCECNTRSLSIQERVPPGSPDDMKGSKHGRPESGAVGHPRPNASHLQKYGAIKRNEHRRTAELTRPRGNANS